MSFAFFSVNSTAAVTVPARSSSTPSIRDWLTMVATSSRVNVEVASSFGSTRNSRRMLFEIQFSDTMIGWKTFDTPTSGVASSSTARSGSVNARFFGTISPNTTCRYETTTSATMNAMTSTAASDMPRASSGMAIRWWIAGSDTFRISSEQIVMPS